MKLQYEKEILTQIQKDIEKLKEDRVQKPEDIYKLNAKINYLYKLASMIESYDY